MLLTIIASQVCFAAYLNTVAYDAASEASAIASTADGTPVAAEAAARRVLQNLSGVGIGAVTQTSVDLPYGSATAVIVRLTSPMLGFGGVNVQQTAQSFNEAH